jgi:hypothetical protein
VRGKKRGLKQHEEGSNEEMQENAQITNGNKMTN